MEGDAKRQRTDEAEVVSGVPLEANDGLMAVENAQSLATLSTSVRFALDSLLVSVRMGSASRTGSRGIRIVVVRKT